jgi:UDP-2,4-diacetamido-2,4,6-trideoxy-beta-L-altropyranose hydrolase
MNIVFRVDSSIKIGSGHLMRCITLSRELKRKNHKIMFVCRKLEGNLISLIEDQVFILPNKKNFYSNDIYLDWLGVTQIQDASEMISIIPKNTDILIIDSYSLDETWHQLLRPFTKKIIVIDDLADRKFDCDILINQNLGTKVEDYKDKILNNCELLLGCKYSLLRPEFFELRVKALEKRLITKKIKNILINFGGSDSNNITYTVLEQLDKSFNIVVVLGKASPHIAMIKDYAKVCAIKVLINTNNMAKLMFDADLMIGAAGTTSWERCSLGLPALLYIVADNQRKIAENLEKSGAVIIIKNLEDDFEEVLSKKHLWKKLSRNASLICDGLGAKRVAQKI